MSDNTETKQVSYVKRLQRTKGRLAVTFRFPAGYEITWWQRKADTEHEYEAPGAGRDWELDTADDFEGTARRLAGEATAPGFPNIAMGDLIIGLNQITGIARIEVIYYNKYGTFQSAVAEAEYVFEMPKEQLIEAFREAAGTIRAEIAKGKREQSATH